jgi:hypothetical protein
MWVCLPLVYKGHHSCLAPFQGLRGLWPQISFAGCGSQSLGFGSGPVDLSGSIQKEVQCAVASPIDSCGPSWAWGSVREMPVQDRCSEPWNRRLPVQGCGEVSACDVMERARPESAVMASMPSLSMLYPFTGQLCDSRRAWNPARPISPFPQKRKEPD